MSETEVYGSISTYIKELPDINIANEWKVAFVWIDTLFINQGAGPLSHVEYHPDSSYPVPSFKFYFKGLGLTESSYSWTQTMHAGNPESIAAYCKARSFTLPAHEKHVQIAIHDALTYEAIRAWIGDNIKETVMACIINASCSQCGTAYRGLARYCGECTKRIQAAESRQYDEMPVEEDESPESSPTQQERAQDFEDAQTGAYDGDELEDHPF